MTQNWFGVVYCISIRQSPRLRPTVSYVCPWSYPTAPLQTPWQSLCWCCEPADAIWKRRPGWGTASRTRALSACVRCHCQYWVAVRTPDVAWRSAAAREGTRTARSTWAATVSSRRGRTPARTRRPGRSSRWTSWSAARIGRSSRGRRPVGAPWGRTSSLAETAPTSAPTSRDSAAS